jgi:maltose-binding protein MalE
MSAAGGQSEFYAVPIIKQALVLFYNKDYLSDSDVVSWEKNLEVA